MLQSYRRELRAVGGAAERLASGYGIPLVLIVFSLLNLITHHAHTLQLPHIGGGGSGKRAAVVRRVGTSGARAGRAAKVERRAQALLPVDTTWAQSLSSLNSQPPGAPLEGEQRNGTSAPMLVFGSEQEDTEPGEEEEDFQNQCAANIYATYQITPNMTFERTRNVPIRPMGSIFSFGRRWRYAHMATLVEVTGRRVAHHATVLAAAWQVAPAADETAGRVKLAVEGLGSQVIMLALSTDGGHSWQPPVVVPTELADAARAYPTWSPVLHWDEPRDRLLLFFTQSQSCRRDTKPPTWDPGGAVYVTSASAISLLTKLDDKAEAMRWSEPRLVLSQEHGAEDGARGIPKVIANSMAVLSNGDWALPFWREQPHKSAKGAGSLCHVDNPQKEAALTSAGVLLSSDFGRSWTPHGTLTHPHTGLIEGSLVELLPEDRRWHVEAAGNSTAAPVLKMFYRTRAGCAFMTDSADGGRIWSAAAPVNLPNPNTKFHVVQLQPSGHLAVAFNDHARGQFCKACRTHLHVAVSRDRGVSWHYAAHVEREETDGVRIHYPSLLQHGQYLYVMYSRFYLDLGRCKTMADKLACRGVGSSNQGIKLARVDLSALGDLPQLALPPAGARERKPDAPAIVRHYAREAVARLRRLKEPDSNNELQRLIKQPWRGACRSIAETYDVAWLGGWRFLADDPGRALEGLYREQLTQQINATRPVLVDPLRAGVDSGAGVGAGPGA